MLDPFGNERDLELAERFWEVILNQDDHFIFMMGYLGDNSFQDEKPSVKIFDWNSPEYEFDFPDPPEISI